MQGITGEGVIVGIVDDGQLDCTIFFIYSEYNTYSCRYTAILLYYDDIILYSIYMACTV